MKNEQRGATIIAAGLSILIGAETARAEDNVVLEEPRPRQGYYVGLSVRGASVGTWDKGESLGQFAGSGFGLRMGQLLTRRIGLGLLIEGGGAKGGESGDVTEGVYGLGFEASCALVGNLAATGTVGFGVVALNDPNADEGKQTRGNYGAAYGLGLTWDFFPWKKLSGGFAVTPSVQARFLPSDTISAVAILFGVDLLYFTGLPRNQLALPDNEAYKK